MIQIYMRNGDWTCWDRADYTEYECNYNLFVVKRGDQWVGIYNMDAVSYIEIDHDSGLAAPFASPAQPDL